MSDAPLQFDPDELPPPVCDSCGFPILETDQRCVARDAGVCSP